MTFLLFFVVIGLHSFSSSFQYVLPLGITLPAAVGSQNDTQRERIQQQLARREQVIKNTFETVSLQKNTTLPSGFDELLQQVHYKGPSKNVEATQSVKTLMGVILPGGDISRLEVGEGQSRKGTGSESPTFFEQTPQAQAVEETATTTYKNTIAEVLKQRQADSKGMSQKVTRSSNLLDEKQTIVQTLIQRQGSPLGRMLSTDIAEGVQDESSEENVVDELVVGDGLSIDSGHVLFLSGTVGTVGSGTTGTGDLGTGSDTVFVPDPTSLSGMHALGLKLGIGGHSAGSSIKDDGTTIDLEGNQGIVLEDSEYLSGVHQGQNAESSLPSWGSGASQTGSAQSSRRTESLLDIIGPGGKQVITGKSKEDEDTDEGPVEGETKPQETVPIDYLSLVGPSGRKVGQSTISSDEYENNDTPKKKSISLIGLVGPSGKPLLVADSVETLDQPGTGDYQNAFTPWTGGSSIGTGKRTVEDVYRRKLLVAQLQQRKQTLPSSQEKYIPETIEHAAASGTTIPVLYSGGATVSGSMASGTVVYGESDIGSDILFNSGSYAGTGLVDPLGSGSTLSGARGIKIVASYDTTAEVDAENDTVNDVENEDTHTARIDYILDIEKSLMILDQSRGTKISGGDGAKTTVGPQRTTGLNRKTIDGVYGFFQAGTLIVSSRQQSISIADLSVSMLDDSSDSFADRGVYVTKFGLEGEHLLFSKPVKISIPVAPGERSDIYRLYVLHEGDDEPTSDGLTLNPDAVCFMDGTSSDDVSRVRAVDGYIEFYTCGASTFILDPDSDTINEATLRVKADAGVNCSTNGCSVSSWQDQSGNSAFSGNSFDQGTPANQPTYVTNAVNYNPVVRFSSASNQYLETPSTVALTSLLGSDFSSGAIYFVGYSTTPEIFEQSNRFEILDSSVKFGTNQTISHSATLNVSTVLFHLNRNGANFNSYENGLLVGTPTQSATAGSLTSAVRIGREGNNYMNGDIGELLIYDESHSTGERVPIFSYLGLKYGISLDSSVGTYQNGSGETIYTIDATYNNRIAGLGRDDVTTLDQRVSSSIGFSTGVRMATENDFITINTGSRTSLNDQQFLIWGDDGNVLSGTQTTNVNTGNYESRLQRQWKIENTNALTGVSVDVVGIPSANQGVLYVLLSDTDTDFTSGATPLATGADTTFVSVDFPSGVSYFTVAYTYAESLPDTVLSGNTVREFSPIGTFIGDFVLSGTVKTGTYSYSLVSGLGDTDNSSFSISGSQLFIEEVSDYDTQTSYSIRVRTTDPDSYTNEAVFSITVIEEPNTCGDGVLDRGVSIFSEDFESINGTISADGTIATGAGGYVLSFDTDTAFGRARYGINALVANQGSGSITLDVDTNTNLTVNYLILEYDMSSFATSTGLELGFSYVHHNEDSQSNDRVRIRGSNTDAWVQVYDWYTNRATTGSYTTISQIDIDDALSGASQSITSTFQVRFGQEDDQIAANLMGDDGLTIDDIEIINTVDPIAEECDDGNNTAGDGCSQYCVLETGFICKSTAECGNGIIDDGELCDDGNTVDGDGCNNFCWTEYNFLLAEFTPDYYVPPVDPGGGLGSGDWVISSGGYEATVPTTFNPYPTAYYSPDNFWGLDSPKAVDLKFQGAADDDYIGYVFGYQPGDWYNPDADFILVAWKDLDQNFDFTDNAMAGGIAEAGLSVMRVQGVVALDELWQRIDDPSTTGTVTVLATGTNYGDIGYRPNLFDTSVFYSTGQIDVYVENQLDISVTGNFQDGRFGIYVFAQQGNTFALGKPHPYSQGDACYGECGDGIVSGDETCDDGNAISGDGCSEYCTEEQPNECNDEGGGNTCNTLETCVDSFEGFDCVCEIADCSGGLTGDVCIFGPSQFAFSGQTIARPFTQVVSQLLSGYFTVEDTLGADSGYYTTLEISSFTGLSYSGILSRELLQWYSTGVDFITGTVNTGVVLATGRGSYRTATGVFTFIERPIGTNNGVESTYGSRLWLSFTVPPYTKPDTYQAIITYTLIEN